MEEGGGCANEMLMLVLVFSGSPRVQEWVRVALFLVCK